MQSFLIIGKNTEQKKETIEQLCNQWGISPFDRIIIGEPQGETEKKAKTETEKKKKEAQTIGIKEIKDLQITLLQTPVQGSHKAIIITRAETLTTEAQNALLKTLEEPPSHTHIILDVTTKDVLLPTILSRCQIITLNETPQTIPSDEKNEYVHILESLPTMNIGERLKLAQDAGKSKEHSQQWIQNVLLVLRKKGIGDDQSLTIAKALQQAYTIITTTNVQPRLVLEQTFLSL